MKIKKYYCPNCKEFKGYLQVYDYYQRFNSPQSLKCKKCKRSIILTEPEFKKFLEEKFKN